MHQYILAILVKNNAGVLARVSSLFGRRGYNIDSLTVSETNNPGISYITLTVTGDDAILDQIIKQAEKLEEVIEVNHIDVDNALGRELLLIKMAIDPATRTALREITDIYRAKIVDLAANTMIIELTGSSSKINAFLKIMSGFSVVEMCRTGVTAMEKDSVK